MFKKEKRRKSSLTNINEGVYKTYKEGMKMFSPKTYPVTNDYEMTDDILGHGYNGQVKICVNKKTKIKYALKVNLIFHLNISFNCKIICKEFFYQILKNETHGDYIYTKREIDLQWRACQGIQIIKTTMVYAEIANNQFVSI